jgi:hypothetical protein
LLKNQKLLVFSIIFLILITNLLKIYKQNRLTTPIFAVQENLTLEDEKKVIDRVFELTKGRPFALNTVTNPLFINTTWAYLFKWYAFPKYHYLPTWAGISQKGKAGQQVFSQGFDNQYLIFIIEPTPGIPELWITAQVEEENLHTKLIQEEKIGTLTLEFRQKLKEDKQKEKDLWLFQLRKKSPDSLSAPEKAILHISNLRKNKN